MKPLKHLLSGLILIATCLSNLNAVQAQAASPPSQGQKSVLATGITGTIRASGLNDPQYVLSFPGIQKLILAAARSSVTETDIDAALVGTPVRHDDLLRLGLLRKDGARYRVAYLVLTVDDQEAIYRVALRFGADLARTIERHRTKFEEIFARFPDAARRDELAFAVVAGILLNWEGLKLNTQLGFRSAPFRNPNGDEYLLHSKEIGANLSEAGLYWESHTFPGPRTTFSTFGDSDSLPRRRAIPDILLDPVEMGLETLKDAPGIKAAVQDDLVAYVGIALVDAGDLVAALADRPMGIAELSTRLNLSKILLRATINLLLAAGYVELVGPTYHVRVPVLKARDLSLVRDALGLGRLILKDWLTNNYGLIRTALAGISPIKNGLPFSLAFNEVWHYIFGVTTKTLAEDGFYLNPRSSRYSHPGYVPLVWDSSLYKF